jgi:hypothetical protein
VSRSEHEASLSLGALTAAPRRSFIKPVVLKETWTWHGLEARRCPRCSCTPDAPCTVVLSEGAGLGTCVPSGAYDLEACSRCA